MADQEPEQDAVSVAETTEAAEQEYRLTLDVQVSDAGPCKKHVKVKVPQDDIQHFREEAVGELMGTAAVPGFRVGRVPRSLIERRFRKEVGAHVKQQILLRSLDQVSTDNNLDAINEPSLDVESLEIPDAGDFNYEFDVEVRPEFTLPNYTGLKIERPVREFTEADVESTQVRYLEQFAQLAPRDEPASLGDFLLLNIGASHNGVALLRKENEQVRIAQTLHFQDSVVADFDKLMVGSVPGDVKTAQTTLSLEADKVELRGETVDLTFEVLDVRRLQFPDLTPEFLRQIDLESPEALREEITKTLDRQLELERRQSARRQVLEKITESADWELPETLVRRQVENARRRDWLEMHQAGYTDEQIRGKESEMMHNRVSATRQALKEHFVLDKIATEEKLQVTPQDVEDHIHYMAFQRGENPRKVRARLEKQGMMENLQAQILEELAVQFVLDKAQFEDVPASKAEERSTVALDFSLAGDASGETQAVTELQQAADRAAREREGKQVPNLKTQI